MRKFSFSLFKTLPDKEFRITLSTCFTLLRIILTPVIVGAMVYGAWGVAFSCFVAASISDMLDGFFARYLNQKTFLGACLDPLADKLLLISVFFTLVFTDILPFGLPLWFLLLVLCKEFLTVFGFLFLYLKNTGIDVNPSWLGKAATALQMYFIGWLFLCYFFGWLPTKTYYVFFSVMVFCTIAALGDYINLGVRCFKGSCYE